MKNAKKTESIFESLLPNYKVDGFNPNAALTKIVSIDENGQPTESLFMKYLPALEWFLTIYPDGCLNHSFVALTDRKAIVTASIYRNQIDIRPAATATCSYYFEENQNGKYYEQNAVTAAYRKALGYLGFGTPLDAVEVEGIPTEPDTNIPEMTDSGVVITPVVSTTPELEMGEAVSSETKTSAKRIRTPKSLPLNEPQAPVEPVIEQITEPIEVKPIEVKPIEVAPIKVEPEEEEAEGKEEEEELQLTPVAAPGIKQAPITVANPVMVTAPVAPQTVPKTLEEALEVIVPYGDLMGKTVEEAANERGGAFIRWHCDKAQMRAPNSAFAMATQLYCEFNGC